MFLLSEVPLYSMGERVSDGRACATRAAWGIGAPTLEATQGQMDGFFSQLPYKCHLLDTNATSKRWHLWEIDFGFALKSTPGWAARADLDEVGPGREAEREPEGRVQAEQDLRLPHVLLRVAAPEIPAYANRQRASLSPARGGLCCHKAESGS